MTHASFAPRGSQRMTDRRPRWLQAFADRTEAFLPRAALSIVLALVAAQAAILFAMGRVPMCTCGTIKLWQGAIMSPETSQQIFDWYTFSHLIHGFALYGLIWLLAPRASVALRLVVAVVVECGWEITENTDMIIDRYRADTISLNYRGDSIINSVSDTLTMILGFGLAAWLPVRFVVAFAIVLEAVAGYAIRDNLTLNIIMLIYPFEAIRAWQGGPLVH